VSIRFFIPRPRIALVLTALFSMAWGGVLPLCAQDSRADMTALLSAPNRLAGTEAGWKAGDHILGQLKGLGGEAFVQRFWFPQETATDCRLRFGGAELQLKPLRANGLQPSNASGLRGPLVLLGDGSVPTGRDLAGAIAVVDLASDGVARRAFAAGVQAVIFVGDSDPDRRWATDKATYVSADLPRFYISREQAGGLLAADGVEAELQADVRWTEREGRNIFFWVPGSEPRFGPQDEFVIVSAPYDTAGLVPENSPSPDRAGNVALLLQMARDTAATPGRRNVLFAFFDNHANFNEGARQFYAALRRANPAGITDPLPVREGYVRGERDHLAALMEELSHKDILARNNPIADGIRSTLRASAKTRYDEYQERIGALRSAARTKRTDGPSADELNREIESLTALRSGWQAMREAVRDRHEIDAAHAGLWEEARSGLVASAQARLAELDRIEAGLQGAVALTNRLSGSVPVLHLALRFSSGNDRWFFLQPGRIRSSLGEFLEKIPASADAAQPVWFRRQASALASLLWQTVEGNAFSPTFGIPALTAVTEQDRAAQDGMPSVTWSPEREAALFAQGRALTPYFRAMLDAPEASAPDRLLQQTKVYLEDYQWLGNKADGHFVKSIGFGETAPSDIERGAIVQIMQRANAPTATTPRYVTRSDGNGIFPLMSILGEEAVVMDEALAMDRLVIEAALFDRAGKIEAISSLRPSGGRGSVEAGWTSPAFFQPKANAGYYSILALFSGAKGVLLGEELPFVGLFESSGFSLLSGLSENAFPNLNFRYDPATGIGSYMVRPDQPARLLYRDTGSSDGVSLYLDAPERMISAGEAGASKIWDLERDMADGMNALNESRLEGLRKRNIILDSLEELHFAAAGQLAVAGAADLARDPDAATRADGRAAALERRVYRPVKETISDMLSAITLLLILAVPFAMAVQALIFPSRNIYWQVGTFAAVFLASFLALYFTHPAFSFSAFPVVILLAFVLMVMSGAVIAIITSKFSHEVKGMQGLVISAHTMRKSATGNVGAAFALAISTMRRRPARTALTIITVLLLTFTILSFVSFQSEKGVTKTVLGTATQPGDLVLVRDRVWKPLSRGFADRVDSLAKETAQTAPRYWQAQELATALGEQLAITLRADSEVSNNFAEASAVLGLDAVECAQFPELRAALGIDDTQAGQFFAGGGILLSPGLAKQLGVEAGGTVRLFGRAVTVLGVFDPVKLQAVRQIDGAPVLPINFRSTQLAMGQVEAAGSAHGSSGGELEGALAKLEPDAFEPVGAESVVLLGAPLAREMDIPLRALSIFGKDSGALERLARELATLSDASIYAQTNGERRWLRFGDQIGVAGLGDVFIPLLVGGLIVFSTMLGSIIDREKEIYTFSALGLTPRNIAMLFFVEAGIYAILGGFGGYLLGQGAALALEALASMGLLAAPKVNYSSSTAINTILLVIAVVMVSTVYPALKAAQKATAETRKRWKIPTPENGVVRMVFPFTISADQIGGVFTFIKEYLDSHADRTIGTFAASDAIATFEPEAARGLLRSKIWLQPFDQGISQNFEIEARPSDIEDVAEVTVAASCVSGPPAAWQRALPGFLESMRKEFLLWRTLPDDVMDHYLNCAEKNGKNRPNTKEHT